MRIAPWFRLPELLGSWLLAAPLLAQPGELRFERLSVEDGITGVPVVFPGGTP